ncbi:MAG TPA: sugar phosphate isomerase/epimerase family protein [Sedimentisphaerales bacterium]|nr:sugar phosphate isomerase/epimerase family protein [Sedimentisphaerales bacterium]
MECKNWPVGVCSWSLQTDIEGVAAAMKRIGLEHVHLGIRGAVEDPQVLADIEDQDWTITATMIDFPQEDYSTLEAIKATGGIVPDDCWTRNRKLFLGAAEVTAKLGVKYLSTHAGFIDESDPAYAKKVHDRIKRLADAAADKELTLLLETGQETATELRSFLEELDHPAVGVNFDPANMILYDKGDPIEALRTLAPWIKHLHVKDATRTKVPGTWGAEVPWGNGQVGIVALIRALEEIGFDGAMAIEREAGNDRPGDIALAADRLRDICG